MILFSFKDNAEIFVTNPFGIPHIWHFENYPQALESFEAVTYFKNSLIVSFVTILIVELSALMFCYVISRVRNRTTKAMHFVVSSGMFIPIQAIMIPLIIVVSQGWALRIRCFPLSFLMQPLVCRLRVSYFMASISDCSPLELEESAYLDGASFPTIYFRIIMPQLLSPIVVLVIYQFMACWNEYNLALILLTKKTLKTLPLGPCQLLVVPMRRPGALSGPLW